MTKAKKVLLCLLLVFNIIGIDAIYAEQEGKIIYVKQDATGLNNGNSWEHAFVHLHDAIEAASAGDQIWIAAGIYLPTGNKIEDDARTVHFRLKHGVTIYGGFHGDEPEDFDLSQREIMKNKTILSGDLLQNDVTDDENSFKDNAYHVIYQVDNLCKEVNKELHCTTNEYATVDGVTITGGYANGSLDHMYGGGIFSKGSRIALFNVNLSELYGKYGGSLYSKVSSIDLQNVMITNNSSSFGGGFYSTDYSTVNASNITISGNTSDDGGGIYNGNLSNVTLVNALLTGNVVKRGGGGIYNINSNMHIINGTISGNYAGERGGGIFYNGRTLAVKNSIIWGNKVNDQSSTNELHLESTYVTDFSKSLIRGLNLPDLEEIDQATIDSSTIFIKPITASGQSTIEGDYRLIENSPAIDKGDRNLISEPTDLLANPRVSGEEIDLGPFEYQYPITVHITVAADPIDGGVVTSSGTYGLEDEVTVTASAYEGYTFTHWSEEGVEVSNTPTYTFIATSDRSLTAHFQPSDASIEPESDPEMESNPEPSPEQNPTPVPNPDNLPQPGHTSPTNENNHEPLSPAEDTSKQQYTIIIGKNRNRIVSEEDIRREILSIHLGWDETVAQCIIDQQTLYWLIENNPNLQLYINADSIEFHLHIAALSQAIATLQESLDVSDYDVVVSIELADQETQLQAMDAIDSIGAEMIVSPIQFRIELIQRDGTILAELTQFHRFITRLFLLPSQSTDDFIGVRYDPVTNRFEPVPTTFADLGDMIVAELHSLSNSYYAILQKEVELLDVEGHWAQGIIEKMATRLMIATSSESLFEPNQLFTHKDAYTLLCRAFGITSTLESTMWETTFNEVEQQNHTITREQFILLLTEIINHLHLDIPTNDRIADVEQKYETTIFHDRDEISPNAVRAMDYAIQQKLIIGIPTFYLLPKQPITKAEAYVIVYRLLLQFGLINE